MHCEECGHDFLVAFSCKQRSLCPSCHQKRELQWAAWAEEELLAEVPHRQAVLTMPKRLRIFFRFDRRLLGELLGCAWRAWRLYIEALIEGPCQPGGVGFVQTAGELLGCRPHIHLLLADGGWLADGSFRHLLWVDPKQLERLWRAEVLRLLVERGRINDEVVQNLLSWRHSGFSVHTGVRVEERREAARLGRTMARCPIVLHRLEWDASSEEVIIHPRTFAEPERLDVLALLARVLDHVPEPRPPCYTDGTPDTLTFDAGASNFSAGIAVWTGSTVLSWNPTTFFRDDVVGTRFTLSVANMLDVPLALTAATTIPGMPPSVGGVLEVTGDFKAHWLMEILAPDTMLYEPAYDMFDRLLTEGEIFYNVGGGFYHTYPDGVIILIDGFETGDVSRWSGST